MKLKGDLLSDFLQAVVQVYLSSLDIYTIIIMTRDYEIRPRTLSRQRARN